MVTKIGIGILLLISVSLRADALTTQGSSLSTRPMIASPQINKNSTGSSPPKSYPSTTAASIAIPEQRCDNDQCRRQASAFHVRVAERMAVRLQAAPVGPQAEAHRMVARKILRLPATVRVPGVNHTHSNIFAIVRLRYIQLESRHELD